MNIPITYFLDKTDLISLVKGTEPNYQEFDNPKIKPYGEYEGGFNDRWRWDPFKLKTMEENELYEIYLICKKSYETI